MVVISESSESDSDSDLSELEETLLKSNHLDIKPAEQQEDTSINQKLFRLKEIQYEKGTSEEGSGPFLSMTSPLLPQDLLPTLLVKEVAKLSSKPALHTNPPSKKLSIDFDEASLKKRLY